MTGKNASSLAPLPRLPKLPSPQHHAVSSLLMPHRLAIPALSNFQVIAAGFGTTVIVTFSLSA